MEIINLKQGTPEWHDFRQKHFTASDAAAMLGLSKYKTRDQLLAEKCTGATDEVTPEKQALFDRGHAAEDAARPLMEEVIGEDLFPVTGRREINGLPLAASFDGLDMDRHNAWEHKLWNQALAEAIASGDPLDVPDTHWPQLEHQLLVSCADRDIFQTSDGTEDNSASLSYYSVPERRERVLSGWAQFADDMKTWKPRQVKTKSVAESIDALPALVVRASGSITESNLEQYKDGALAIVRGISTDLETDQDFANAEAALKFCKAGEDKLKASKAAILEQTASIDQVFKVIDEVSEEMRQKRLELDKLIKARKTEIRNNMASQAVEDLAKHVEAINQRNGRTLFAVDAVGADFIGSMKGKKTVDGLQDGVDNELARAKIEASRIGDLIAANLKAMADAEKKWPFMFNDIQLIIGKAPDDFEALVKMRVTEQEAREKQSTDADAKIKEFRTITEEAKEDQTLAAREHALAALQHLAPSSESHKIFGEHTQRVMHEYAECKQVVLLAIETLKAKEHGRHRRHPGARGGGSGHYRAQQPQPGHSPDNGGSGRMLRKARHQPGSQHRYQRNRFTVHLSQPGASRPHLLEDPI
jgi:putative phage-type endonuclease